jgi:hypothetical protein
MNCQTSISKFIPISFRISFRVHFQIHFEFISLLIFNALWLHPPAILQNRAPSVIHERGSPPFSVWSTVSHFFVFVFFLFFGGTGRAYHVLACAIGEAGFSFSFYLSSLVLVWSLVVRRFIIIY